MRINKIYYNGIGACVLMAAVAGLFLNRHESSLKDDYSIRMQNMEYVKRNAQQRYINTLEELNQSKSPRIIQEDINDLWMKAAAAVKDSLELTKNKISK